MQCQNSSNEANQIRTGLNRLDSSRPEGVPGTENAINTVLLESCYILNRPQIRRTVTIFPPYEPNAMLNYD